VRACVREGGSESVRGGKEQETTRIEWESEQNKAASTPVACFPYRSNYGDAARLRL